MFDLKPKKWAANGQQEQIEPMIKLAEKPRKQLMMKRKKMERVKRLELSTVTLAR